MRSGLIIYVTLLDLEEMAMRLDTERHNSHQLSQRLKEYTGREIQQKKSGPLRSHKEQLSFDFHHEHQSPNTRFGLKHAEMGEKFTSPSAKKVVEWHSTSRKNERQYSHPVIKEFTAREALEDARSAHSHSGLRASQKMQNNQSIQCDLQLETLVDHDEELHNHIQELKEQIIQRDYEIQSLKVIATFITQLQ